MDARLRKTLRGVARHLATLVTCYRTRDRTLLENVPAFVAGRHLHTFALDSGVVIHQIEAVVLDAVPMSPQARELLAVVRSYLTDLEGVLVIEPPSFTLPPRQMDLRCTAFRPEVEAFSHRIEDLITTG